MSIKINIHKTHRQFTNGLDVIEVDGNTVSDCLENLARQFTGFKEAIFVKKENCQTLLKFTLTFSFSSLILFLKN